MRRSVYERAVEIVDDKKLPTTKPKSINDVIEEFQLDIGESPEDLVHLEAAVRSMVSNGASVDDQIEFLLDNK